MTSVLSTVRPAIEPDDHFRHEILEGLRAPQKYISSKWLYDDVGSALFEDITDVEEYYPTRTEAKIFDAAFPELINFIPEYPVIIEFGSGASLKIRKLIEATKPTAYVPIDIAEEFMLQSVEELKVDFPKLIVYPVVADLMQRFELNDLPGSVDSHLGFFPGSTIGNFTRNDAVTFLRNAHDVLTAGAHLLISADLVKDTVVLEGAYDDAKGVTAAFNKNLLARINRELGANFDLSAFEHRAVFDTDISRIEMHLVSTKEQTVLIDGVAVHFENCEYIHTENSYKYTKENFESLLLDAGWELEKMWIDEQDWFGVFLAKAV